MLYYRANGLNNKNKIHQLKVRDAIYLFVEGTFIHGLCRFSAGFDDVNEEACDLAWCPAPEFLIACSRSRHTIFLNMMRYTAGT